ncbi:hypothetical protein GGF46_001446 [Coemansia sp. RSA 552]|nr:hypothetical protein GGF46_001446 [Coemansia sp. RSA 552]
MDYRSNSAHWGGASDDAASRSAASKRQRISRACDRCRRKKVKCDGRRPICTHCEAIGCSCTYLDATKKRGPPKGYIDAIEGRLHAVEGLLQGLVTSDPKAARYVLDSLKERGSDSAASVCDSDGLLFGSMTAEELEAHAAGRPAGEAAGGSASQARVSQAPRVPASYDCTEDDYTESLSHLGKGVGHLTLDPTGSLRYLGDSSGWYIVNRSLLTSDASPRLTKGPPMPDFDEQIRLVSLYFKYVHPVFPILYKSHFLMRAFDRDMRPQPALMSAVFAAASTYKAREAQSKDGLARVRIQMAVHFQRAKMYLDEQYTHNTIASILTLLLMSVYEQGTMSTRSWLYSGMAIRKAYDLGLHRDVGMAKHEGSSVLSRTETELRQRAWWGCYTMDIMVSATLGRPTTIRDFTFDVPYPADYGEDDDELLVNSSMADEPSIDKLGTSLPAQGPDAAVRPPSPVQGSRAVAERMRDYVALSVGESDEPDTDAEEMEGGGSRQAGKPLGVYYLDLLHILGHVLTEMYTCRPHRSYATKYCLRDLHSRTERLVILDHELRRWKRELPSELQYPVEDIIATRPARCVYIALIHLVYYTAMILLHRPFISRLGSPGKAPGNNNDSRSSSNSSGSEEAGASGASEKANGLPSPLPSHSICTTSAQMISLIGQAIIQGSRIFVMPFLTFMMFSAGTMHLNNVIVASDSRIARGFLKRSLNVMSRLGAHWQVSYKCYTMLNTLVRANRIELDQVVDDDNGTGLGTIRERYRENSRMAHAVYEGRLRRGEQKSYSPPCPKDPAPRSTYADKEAVPTNTPHNGRTGSKPILLPRPGTSKDTNTGPGRLPVATSAPLQPSQQASTGTTNHGGTVVDGDGSIQDPAAASSIGAKIFGLQNQLDANGRPIVPASPYTSVDLHPRLPRTQTSENGGTASALGQFVPSLEFFANADYPLGIGGPNGQASMLLPQAIPVYGDGRAGSRAGETSAGPARPAGTLSMQSALGAAQARAAERPAQSSGSAAVSGNSDLTPANLGFSGVLIDDDVIRNLPFSGPVSYDLGLGEADGGLSAANAGEASWREYFNELIRMFGGGQDMATPPTGDKN